MLTMGTIEGTARISHPYAMIGMLTSLCAWQAGRPSGNHCME